MRPHLFHPDADAEATAATTWYRSRDPGAARGFVREIDQAILAIRLRPFSFTLWPGVPVSDSPVRRCLLQGYPFSVAFTVADSAVVIIAVAHQKRRPGYWRRRLR